MVAAQVLTGRYEYTLRTGHWWWSDELYAIFGASRNVALSVESFLSRVHVDDRNEMREAFKWCCEEGGAWGGLWRILRDDGRQRYAAYSGTSLRRAGSYQSGCVSGYVVDVTEVHREAVNNQANEQIDKALTSRVVIDEAKGALMLLYGMDGEAAFETLKWCSQRTNEKLAVIARRITEAVRSGLDVGTEVRQRLDEVMYALTNGAEAAGVAAPHGLRTVVAGEHENAHVLQVSGDVDLATVVQFSGAVTRLVSETPPAAAAVVDLRNADHFGSAGIPVLLSAKRKRDEVGGTLTLVVSNQAVDFSEPRRAGLKLYRDLEEATHGD